MTSSTTMGMSADLYRAGVWNRGDTEARSALPAPLC